MSKYNSPDCREAKHGDWVRWMNSGRMVIGKVEYIKERTGGFVDLYTDNGCVSIESVLEVRRSA